MNNLKLTKQINKMKKENKTKPLVIVDGESIFNNFVSEAEQANPKVIELAKDWKPLVDALGDFNMDWLRSLLKGEALEKATSIISEKADTLPPFQADSFQDHYTDKVDDLLNKFNDKYIPKFDNQNYPYQFKFLNGFSLLDDNSIDLNPKFLESIRPHFDEVLTSDSDIEFYHLLNSTADSINILISELEKRNFPIMGNNFMNLFINQSDRVTPRNEGLKFKLSINKQ